jgi:hypothetical protein
VSLEAPPAALERLTAGIAATAALGTAVVFRQAA